MAEEVKKRGLFKRLFGKKVSESEETPDEQIYAENLETYDQTEIELSDAAESHAIEFDEAAGREFAAVEIEAAQAADQEPGIISPDEQSSALKYSEYATVEADAEEARPDLPEAEETGEAGEAEETEQVEKPEGEAKPKGLFGRLRKGLSKTRSGIAKKMDRIFLGKKVIDAETLDDLEEALVTADLGVHSAMKLIEGVREKVGRKELSDIDALRAHLKKAVAKILISREHDFNLADSKPFVLLVVGVNGVGKTTTIGKIAAQYRKKGHSVLLAAGDTFRAAAIEQLEVWAERTDSRIVRHEHGSDSAAVAFDAVESAKARNVDLAIIDTAGRLHTKTNLMEELKKVKRVIGKVIPGAPHHVLLVLDSTTGQNAISQAKIFNEAVQVDSVAVTKLDGTAKGGVVVGICDELGLPIQFVGVGEQIEDLCPFDPEAFIEALF